jgi:hypothetical protein
MALTFPTHPEADMLIRRRWWGRVLGWSWAGVMLITAVVVIVDGLTR